MFGVTFAHLAKVMQEGAFRRHRLTLDNYTLFHADTPGRAPVGPWDFRFYGDGSSREKHQAIESSQIMQWLTSRGSLFAPCGPRRAACVLAGQAAHEAE